MGELRELGGRAGGGFHENEAKVYCQGVGSRKILLVNRNKSHQQRDKHCFRPKTQWHGRPRKADACHLGKGSATPILRHVTKKGTRGS